MWWKKHNLEAYENEKYVRSIMGYFEIPEEKYNISYFNSVLSILVNGGLYKYVIFPDKEHSKLILLEENVLGNNKYHKLNIEFSGDSAYYRAIEFIKDRKIRKG